MRHLIALYGITAVTVMIVVVFGQSAITLNLNVGEPATGQTCTGADVTTSTFSTRISGSTNGNTLCLLNGSYGSFTGTNKAITIAAKTGQTPTMTISFGSGDTGFTLDGMTGMSGDFLNGATNITVRNSTFTGGVGFAGASTDGIVMDNNTHNWAVTGNENKITIDSDLTGTVASPSVTIRDSEIKNGSYDGVKFLGGTVGVIVEDNEFSDLCVDTDEHTDNIQFDSTDTSEVRISGNYIHLTSPCETQGIASYDSGTVGVIIEDNVVDIYRAWGIELFSDEDSVVRHNTLRYRAASASTNDDDECDYFTISCGKILLDAKPADPSGSGTLVYDNIATQVEIGDATATQHHNMCRLTGCTGTGALNSSTPTFVDGPYPDTYAGYCLASGSTGENVASDGLDIGIRC